MNLPQLVTQSRLWQRVEGQEDYVHVISEIRAVAEALGSRIHSVLPEFTDHSVKHMDALWAVVSDVLSSAEIAAINPAEAFILGASFYLHDLGMALAATNQGLAEIRTEQNYKAVFQQLTTGLSIKAAEAETLAIRATTRHLHAKKAFDLATKQIPGLERFLIEGSELRNRWAHHIGQVAASHHWNMDRLHSELGSRGNVPTADGWSVDLGYLACVLRVVDFAHINRERAATLDRALRFNLPLESILHWDAQEKITGPTREDDYLVYGCTEPINKIDAWWLFFDLASGLDAEIRSVRDYLKSRVLSKDRFSLVGVKNVESPERFINSVQLAGDTAPIDIRVQPHSMERVIEMLGGPQLYGADALAPIRELIQNARDAVELRRLLDLANGRVSPTGQIVITLDDSDGVPVLSVTDNGVGMSRAVIARHLIAVGSDFWHSLEFFQDYGKAVESGFKPIGRFGIGFLSVFMLGNRIEVESESLGNPSVSLKLRGVGRRGELKEKSITGNVGTTVRIYLNPGVVSRLDELPAIVRARAPMLGMPILVRRKGTRVGEDTIEPGWWKAISEAELKKFAADWAAIAHTGKVGLGEKEKRSSGPWFTSRDKFAIAGWPGSKPEYTDDLTRVISLGNGESVGVVRCSLGIAIDCQPVRDLTGLTECGELPLLASRESTTSGPSWLRFADPDLTSRLTEIMRPKIVDHLNDVQHYGLIPARLRFLRELSSIYGHEVLKTTALRWVPVIEPPGNLIHHSSEEIVKVLTRLERVVIVCGAGPASIYASAAAKIPHDDLARLIIIITAVKEIDVTYTDRENLKREGIANPLSGSLDEIFAKVPETRSNLLLTTILLDIVGQAWGKNSEAMVKGDWCLDYEADVLWIDLKR